MAFEWKMPDYYSEGITYSLCFNSKMQLRLRITGTGRIPGAAEGQPWKNNAKRIQDIWIEEGITEIGKEAFAGSNALERIWLPESLERIEERAFADCPNLWRLAWDGTEIMLRDVDPSAFPADLFDGIPEYIPDKP